MIDSIVTQLTNNCPTLSQVTRADAIGLQAIDNDATITSLLTSIVSGRIYPLTLPDSPAHPSIVYSQAKSHRVGPEGYEVIREDAYIIELRADSFGSLVTLTSSVRSALQGHSVSGQAGAIEITDAATGYEEETKTYTGALEITITHLAMASQVIPAAIVYPISSGAGDNEFDNIIGQQVREQIGVLILDTTTDIETTRAATLSCLLGFDVESNAEPLQYQSGDAMAVNNAISTWREIYSYVRYIRS